MWGLPLEHKSCQALLRWVLTASQVPLLSWEMSVLLPLGPSSAGGSLAHCEPPCKQQPLGFSSLGGFVS